ncbi:K(+) efflux antiporter 3, chloroplastic [Linum grandiflorum]
MKKSKPLTPSEYWRSNPYQRVSFFDDDGSDSFQSFGSFRDLHSGRLVSYGVLPAVQHRVDTSVPIENIASRKLGFPILYGDGSRPEVLRTAGFTSPKAVIVTYAGKKKTLVVQRLRLAFPRTSLQLGSKLLKGLGVMSDDVNFLSQLVRDSMELQAQEELDRSDESDMGIMKPLQVRVSDSNGVNASVSFEGKAEQMPLQI